MYNKENSICGESGRQKSIRGKENISPAALFSEIAGMVVNAYPLPLPCGMHSPSPKKNPSNRVERDTHPALFRERHRCTNRTVQYNKGYYSLFTHTCTKGLQNISRYRYTQNFSSVPLSKQGCVSTSALQEGYFREDGGALDKARRGCALTTIIGFFENNTA